MSRTDLIANLRSRHRLMYPASPMPSVMTAAADALEALEQQNVELVAALELCKKHMVGDKWDSLFIDGVLSKVKQT